MQIDLRTVSIQPLRQTYNHIADYLGADKAASRYVEATMGVQGTTNFHYRPTWDPEREMFDERRTAIKMRDWYVLKDPRQYYYGSYTQARARMQETAESDFDFVESRGLAESYDDGARRAALDFYIPLRHVAWGGNLNGGYQSAYGYGTAITQASLYASMDQLGIAQYLTRLGLLMGNEAELEAGKHAWLNAPAWQPLRKYVEDSFVIKDWFENFVAQNMALDGLLFGLAYREVDRKLNERAGPTISMLTRFPAEWFPETSKWVDAVVKATAAESAENKAQLQEWYAHWADRAQEALMPVAQLALGEEAGEALSRVRAQLDARMAKAGLAV
ncbi:aromatic/alkene monooxygenase hydroxylase subunit beta [Comamonas sp. NLF-1-9]|uniref:aromatic/alkene monooxygenase hydroxylase subunit beta n=1 Tax=Comamonas sp. NLF-1-9 TaxID=2853163 RepID=UPI001C483595|nr:aromatic/alkene monooxygenase hydroxylase subunit beta [Comamonas sp. NLF-1-9]QXL83756.1 aromatic/alkene monooxygenase hydroxylase subunit beta [Comamonas sp. NLF-1-9]